MHVRTVHTTLGPLAVALTVFTPLGLASVPANAAQTYVFAGHTYFLTNAAESWSSAEAEAIADGGNLTAVNSAAENAFLTTTFASGNLPLWLGGNDIVNGVQTHTYHWTNGGAFVYSNWNLNEPNDTFGNEDDATISRDFAAGYNTDHSTWNDVPPNGTAGRSDTSNGPYFGIVELAAAPEPSQTASLALGSLALTGLVLKARTDRGAAA